MTQTYREQWPDHCAVCGGSGLTVGTYDRETGASDRDLCPRCLDVGTCPRCGNSTMNDELDCCTTCGWTLESPTDPMWDPADGYEPPIHFDDFDGPF